MILSNATAITVSATAYSDIFWAIRGAGHNFGILTEFTSNVYDVAPNAPWSYAQFIFAGDKVEQLYAQVNKMQNEGTAPVELINYSLLLRMSEFDPVNVSTALS